MTCCVIGGGGFIGRHLVERLLATGRDVRVFGRRSQRPACLSPQVSYFSCGYGGNEIVATALGDVDEVIDLAYSTVPKTSFDDPVQDIETNLPRTVSLLRLLVAKESIRKLVIVSSGGTVYGPAMEVPITEDHPTNPISPYGITKLTVEKYALMYQRLYDLPTTIVRPSNAFGEGQLPNRGQGFIATTMDAIVKGKTVTVFGGDQIVRDYIHVADVADGIIAVLQRGRVGTCYNIGSGTGRTTNEVLSAICVLAEQAGRTVIVEQRPVRIFDVAANILSATRIETETGWRSRIGFSDGLARAWRWFIGCPDVGESLR
jgi:UDP-glucose 4-epimerase